jgi:NitT/TauT family transport system substrate-binding protein
MNKLKIALVGIIAILVVGVLSFSFSLGIPTGSVVYDKPELKVTSQTTMLGIVLEIGKEKGFYDEEGIDVDLMQVESSKESMPALAGGDLDIVLASISAGSFNHLARNEDMTVIADGARVIPAILVRKDLTDEILDIEDLKGRVFITPREGSASYYALSRILDSAGLSIEDIVPEYLKQNEAVAAFETRQIEAGIVNEPFATSMAESGIAVKFDFSKIEQAFPEGGQQHMMLFATKRTLQDEEAVRKFLRAFRRSAEFYIRALDGQEPYREEVIRIASKVYGVESEIIEKSRWPGISGDVRPDIEYLKEVQEFYLEKGLIDRAVDLEQRVNLDFLE